MAKSHIVLTHRITKHQNRLMEAFVEGKVSTILIVHKDRFVRFVYEWFEQFLNKLGVPSL